MSPEGLLGQLSFEWDAGHHLLPTGQRKGVQKRKGKMERTIHEKPKQTLFFHIGRQENTEMGYRGQLLLEGEEMSMADGRV